MRRLPSWVRAATLATGALLAACLPPAVSPSPTRFVASTPTTPPDVIATATVRAKQAIKVGIFVDGTFGDGALLDNALAAKTALEQHHQAQVTTYEGAMRTDRFVEILGKAGAENDLVFVLGLHAVEATIAAAREHPSAHFVYIDAAVESPAVSSIVYRDQEGCFLSGALAALLTRDTTLPAINERKIVGFVGGVEEPTARRCEAAYIQGAKEIDPEVTVLSAYVGSWSDPAGGRSATLRLRDAGADVVFVSAGPSGEGGVKAAGERGDFYVIGSVFGREEAIGNHVPASVLKNVSHTIVSVVRRFREGAFKRGTVESQGLAEGGLGIVYDPRIVVGEKRSRLVDLEQQVRRGEIKVTQR
ncbi:MAG TPA: BMP family ABC transporter substrate-binding protein [Chloroflexota bacterium]